MPGARPSRKSLLLLAGGAVAGAVLMLFALPAADSGAPGLMREVAGFAFGRAQPGRQSPVSIAGRLDAYREAGNERDPAALAAAIESVARAPYSPARDLEIDALLGQLTSLSPDYAATVAVALGLEAHFVAEAYLSWAESDAEAALAGLTQIRQILTRRQVSLALTDIFGDDGRGIARIAQALPPGERDALRIDWLQRRAATDPFGALREALALPDRPVARRALQQVATVWAAEDPYGALGQADLMPDDLAVEFRQTVYTEWARQDPEGFASHVESGAVSIEQAVGGFSYLLQADPALAERLAATAPSAIGNALRTSALSAVARTDIAAAKARAEAFAPGQERDQAVRAVADALVQDDPEAAIAWLRGLSPPVPNATRTVVLQLAQTDIVRAIELLAEPEFGSQSALLLAMLTSTNMIDPAQLPAAAGRLLGRNDPQSTAALRRLVSNWMQRDPATALDWVLENEADVEVAVLTGAAQTLAARDPRLAVSYVDRIPPAMQASWISQVASQYGRFDPLEAVAWLTRYQGRDFYDIAAREMVIGMSRTDPRAAAEFLMQSNATVQLATATSVASLWAEVEPGSAARWADRLPDPELRQQTVERVVIRWATSDPVSARLWVLEQRPGDERDRSLRTVMMVAAQSGRFDRDTLAAFSSDQARRQALSNVIAAMARNHPDEARAILDREVADLNERARLEAQIGAIGQIAR